MLKKKECFLQGAAGKYRYCFLQSQVAFLNKYMVFEKSVTTNENKQGEKETKDRVQKSPGTQGRNPKEKDRERK